MKGRGHHNFGYKVLGFLLVVVAIIHVSTRSNAYYYFSPVPLPPADSTRKDSTAAAAKKDSLKFPIYDHQENLSPVPGNTGMDLHDPSNIKKTIEYDAEENKYYLSEKIGDEYIRNPTYLTMEEYLKYQGDQDENSYWKRRLDALTMFNKKPELPTMYREGLFDRIFGGTGIQVRPQGNVDVTLGMNGQNIKNPALTQRQQKYSIFNFDLQMNVNLLATIGDKMKLNISNNTKATFDYQNMQKVEYTGKEDEIIKKIEAGNISFPLKSTLLSGRQSLFGLKTQLQFGKLWVTGVLSQQKSKQNSLTIQGGAQTQQFSIKADAYEENKNFLLAHYFRDNYNKTMKDFPVLNSLVTINKIEVWITNRTGAVTGVRNILGFMDLGEKNPYNTSFNSVGSSVQGLPDNQANSLYSTLQQDDASRQQSRAVETMTRLFGIGSQGRDFEYTLGRKLSPSEYTFNPQLGYISINAQPNPDDIIGVAYRYTYNGKVYQVGEFAEDLPPDTTNQKVIYLKLLKGTSSRPRLPIWDLMMKNVYVLGGYGLSRDNFRLNILYQDPGGGEKRYLPEGASSGIPLLTVLNLDRLNQQNDPSPDGVFDFIDGLTVNTQQGKIIFPVLEPFGSDLATSLGPDPVLQLKYPYQILYDSTKTVALQSQQNNRYIMRGTYKSATSSEIALGGFNIPQGSVSVTAGGQRLVENLDYQIDYGLGRVKILNSGIMNSGIPINIQYEDNATFGFQQQNFMATRFDYIMNPQLTLGGTFMRLTERPFTQKTTVGEDPIRNTNLGLDASYQSEFPALTRALDKLPLYATTTSSFITASGEVAGLFPGHSKVINGVDPGGTVYLDDFEGTRSSFDLKFPIQSWALAATPVGARDKNGNLLFPEATRDDTLAYGYNRAMLNWYMLEPTLIDPTTGGVPGYVKKDPDQHYIRLIQQQDVFPQVSNNTLQNALSTFDLSFYPQERGPYNFDDKNVDWNTGKLLNAPQRWGGITRYIDNTDFEQSNVEFIELWMMDPFLGTRNASKGGSLYINLGDISEDVLKDHSMAFENGITNPPNPAQLTTTRWGYVPTFSMQITRSFDNDPAARNVQDVGYDCMDNSGESERFSIFMSNMGRLSSGSPAAVAALAELTKDPASDDYRYFRDGNFGDAYILQRYKRYNGSQGNSPITDGSATYSMAATTVPESEDLNRDNTLNEAENYYQYRIDLTPNMQVGTNFIASSYVNNNAVMPDGTKSPETWYQFKIPIADFQQKVGNISDFRSIRFMRMFLNGFEDSTTLRFAKLQLGRNTWRRYMYSLLTPGENIPIDNSGTPFNLLSVSVEENSLRTPVNYVIPPGVTRQQAAVSNGQNVQQNEQSISLQFCNLKDGDARGVFKSLGFDLRQFENLRLFVHCESQVGQATVNNGDLEMFLRIGSDFTNNYYEYRKPMNVTLPGAQAQSQVWPAANEVNLILNDLVEMKTRRNEQNLPAYVPYEEKMPDGSTIVVVGQPNTGDAKNVMLGVSNPKKDNTRPGDDGLAKCAEVWFDELRVSGITEKAAYAAAGKVNIQMADLGSVKLSGSMHTAGYGNIDQRVNQRSQESVYTYDASSNLNVGKLMPKDWGVQLPFFVGYSQNVSNPKYNPYDLDQKMENVLDAATSPARRDSLRRAAQDFTSISSFNIANARILGNTKNPAKKARFYSIKNFDFSYSYNKQYKHNSMIESDIFTTQTFGLGYTYSFKSKSIEPFKKYIKSKSKWFSLVKDFNFNLRPSNFTFRNDMNRMFNETQVRVVGDGSYKIAPTYYKNFIWTRSYNMRWELTRSLSFDYNATNKSRVDEPTGRINTADKRDSLWAAVARLGRNTQFTQGFNASYSVPLSKLPITDWTSLKLTYGSTFNWTAASQLAAAQGNTLGNTRQKQINGELNFTQLYNKSRWLKAINAPVGSAAAGRKTNSSPDALLKGKPGLQGPGALGGGGVTDLNAGGAMGAAAAADVMKQPDVAKKKKIKRKDDTTAKVPQIDLTGLTDKQVDSVRKVQIAQETARRKAEKEKRKKERIAARLLRRNTPPEISSGLRIAGKLLTMVKRTTVSYAENGGTIVPGFMDSTRYLGVSSTGSPGLAYAFGYQPDMPWLENLANSGKLSRDDLFNAQFQQTYSQNFTVTAQVEPISDLRIDVSLNRTFTKSRSELFKDTGTGRFEHLTPYVTGSFTQSYMGLKTMFRPSSAASGTFLQFMKNREQISNRLGKNNPYVNGSRDPNDPNYAKGYTAYSQEVLIPAFLAAYTGKDAATAPLLDNSEKEKISSNPFKYFIPMPNWRIAYTGLGKLPVLKDIFNNFVVSSAYTGSMAMNSFNSSLMYNDLLGVGFPSFIDSNSGNFVPYFQVPNITLSDQLNPLIAIDASFKSQLTTRFEVRKTRVVSLSLIDYQVSETKSMEYVFGLGYRVKGLRLPFAIAGKRKLENDLNIKVDVGLREDKTTNTYIANPIDVVSRGQRVLTISPTIDYLVSQSLTLRLFYNRSQTIPYVSTSFPITTTSGGLTLRFMFAQ